MVDQSLAEFTPQELEQLQQARLAVVAFQNNIATLPADEQNDARSEQFNQVRLAAKAVLNDKDFDKKVPKAVSEEVVFERSQRVILPRLSGLVIFGVILALLGLGLNSIILDDFLVNSLGCLVSSGGMALVIGAFVVWTVINSRRRLSNLGDLYQRCSTLIAEIENVLNGALPGWAERSAGANAAIPSVVDLALDSLQQQAADWQQKLRELEEQRLVHGSSAPLDLKLNMDFVERELQRVRREIERLQGPAAVPIRARVVMPPGVKDIEVDSTSFKRAKSVTMDMPITRSEGIDSASAPQDE